MTYRQITVTIIDIFVLSSARFFLFPLNHHIFSHFSTRHSNFRCVHLFPSFLYLPPSGTSPRTRPIWNSYSLFPPPFFQQPLGQALQNNLHSCPLDDPLSNIPPLPPPTITVYTGCFVTAIHVYAGVWFIRIDVLWPTHMRRRCPLPCACAVLQLLCEPIDISPISLFCYLFVLQYMFTLIQRAHIPISCSIANECSSDTLMRVVISIFDMTSSIWSGFWHSPSPRCSTQPRHTKQFCTAVNRGAVETSQNI